MWHDEVRFCFFLFFLIARETIEFDGQQSRLPSAKHSSHRDEGLAFADEGTWELMMTAELRNQCSWHARLQPGVKVGVWYDNLWKPC